MFKLSRSLVGLVLFILVCLRGLVWYVDATSLPDCLEHEDQSLLVLVNAVNPGFQDTVILDASVESPISQRENTSCSATLLGRKLRLSWYYPTLTLLPGARINVLAKLRKPWGNKNPGGFDYRLWLLGQGYVASGYIKAAQQISAGAPSARLLIASDRYVNAALLNAVLLGRKEQVSDAHWALFRETGTIHLMVVSGLHVGVFVAVFYVLTMLVLRGLTLRHSWFIPHFIALAFSLVAIGLLFLQTGMTAPVVRAGLMCGSVAIAFLMLRRVSWWAGLAAISLIAIALEPRFLVQQGFWLSYAAVVSLLWAFATRLRTQTGVRVLLAGQVVLFFALLPWLGVTVGEVPLISSLANIIVVPVITLVTIPFGITAVILDDLPLLSQIAHGCFLVADFSLSLAVHVLTSLKGKLPSIGYFSTVVGISAYLAFWLLATPLSSRLKMLALFGWLPVLLPIRSEVPRGEFRVINLDVGQGSSAILDTQHHRLVVDAGAAYPSGYNVGSAVVIPALRATGPRHIDRILISHSDNDHAGGVTALIESFPSAQVTGLKHACRDGEAWRWDGVEFSILHDANGRTSNDRSCTLLVSNGVRTIYLSGDISAQVERRIVQHLPHDVDMLLAPHHGSASSSSNALVRRLRPKIVVFSAGKGNRYQHPRAEIVERYQRIGATVYTTATTGAITWRSDTSKIVELQRRDLARFW